jgi:hypothetical protein
MQIKSFLFAAFCFTTLAACHHHEDDITAPAITIENPTEGASISGEVHVHIHVTDESLHEMDVKVTKDSDGSELFTASPAVHDETDYHFEAYFTPSVAAETAVTMTVTVIDHGDNSSTKTVKFTVKP